MENNTPEIPEVEAPVVEEKALGALEMGMPVTEFMRADEVVSEVFDPKSDAEINIIPAESVTDNVDVELVLGDKVVLPVDVTPWIANNPGMVWETKNPEIIYIHPVVLEEGTIEAVGVGETTVTATNPLDNAMACVYNITVTAEAKKENEKPEGPPEDEKEGDDKEGEGDGVEQGEDEL